MIIPTNYRPRKGDVLLVRATVRWDFNQASNGEDISISVGKYDSHATVDREQIARVLIPFFNVGEIVTIDGIAGIWQIRGIQNDACWVQSTDGVFKTIEAAALTLAPKTLADTDGSVEY